MRGWKPQTTKQPSNHHQNNTMQYPSAEVESFLTFMRIQEQKRKALEDGEQDDATMMMAEDSSLSSMMSMSGASTA